MDISPSAARGGRLIQGYGDGRFRIAGRVYNGSVLVFPERSALWDITPDAPLTFDALTPVIEAAGSPDILLIGCGAAFGPEPPGLRRQLKAVGMALEWMDTGAACRTFNILLSEGRACAAALIAVE